jgi:hypothetical protein
VPRTSSNVTRADWFRSKEKRVPSGTRGLLELMLASALPVRHFLSVSRRLLSISFRVVVADDVGLLPNSVVTGTFEPGGVTSRLTLGTVTLVTCWALLEPLQLAVCPVKIDCVEQPAESVTVSVTV